MRLLLDTNVLVAALVARGVCADLLEHCVRTHLIISSSALLNEIRDVLSRKFHQRDADVRATVRLFSEASLSSPPPPSMHPSAGIRMTTLSLRRRWLASALRSSPEIRTPSSSIRSAASAF